MSLKDLQSYRMVAKLVLQQQGDDAELATNIHFVPQIQSIVFHPVLTNLALVANQQSVYIIESVQDDLPVERRILQQFKTPQSLILKQAIFCPSLQYIIKGCVSWKEDLFMAIIYQDQRLIHVIDPTLGTVYEATLPFIPNQIICSTVPATSKQAYLLPQAIIAIGEKSFAVIAIHDQPGFLGTGELSLSVTEVVLPTFGASSCDVSPNIQFGSEPDQVFVQHGNYFYKYRIHSGQPKEDHEIDRRKFNEEWKALDKSIQDIQKHEIVKDLLTKLWSPAETCELLKIFLFQTSKILNFQFSMDHQKLAILTTEDIQVFQFDNQNGNIGKLLNQMKIDQLYKDLKFIPKFINFDESINEDIDSDNFDIFQEDKSADISSINLDQEISTGEEFKSLLDQVDRGENVTGAFDSFLINSEIVNLKTKKSVKLVNQLRQHPHLYDYFKQIYLSGKNDEIYLQSEIINFGQEILFTQDDQAVMVRPNIFSGFVVFQLNDKEDTSFTKIQWQPVNISSMQDYQQKKCSQFVPGHNIILLGVGNALYISAKQQQ